MEQDYNVFISAKNLDENGHPTEDIEIAGRLWECLTKLGFRVFFSKVSLEKLGESAYKIVIDDALDRATVLVVVCTSAAHAESKWIQYEWNGFQNEIISRRKPRGQVFVYLINESVDNLPFALRQLQHINHGPDGFNELARFIANAIGLEINETGRTQREHFDVPQIAGEWEGQWKRDSGSILHTGRLSITQTEQRLTALLKVRFERWGRTTEIEERLRGLTTATGIVLQGESYRYIKKGASTSYLLDHFELEPDPEGTSLSGVFFSKKGPGKARFTRIRHENSAE